MNTQQMMEEIGRLARLCEAKDEDYNELALRYARADNELSEAQSMIAMQAEALKAVEPWLICAYSMPPRTPEADYMLSEIKKTILSSSETIAAWRAKETDPLRREIAKVRSALTCAYELIDAATIVEFSPEAKQINSALDDTQATALAYEREVQAKALEGVLKLEHTGMIVPHEIRRLVDELRSSKGEVK